MVSVVIKARPTRHRQEIRSLVRTDKATEYFTLFGEGKPPTQTSFPGEFCVHSSRAGAMLFLTARLGEMGPNRSKTDRFTARRPRKEVLSLKK